MYIREMKKERKLLIRQTSRIGNKHVKYYLTSIAKMLLVVVYIQKMNYIIVMVSRM